MIEYLVKNLAVSSKEAALSTKIRNVTNSSSTSKITKPFNTTVSNNVMKEMSQKESIKTLPRKTQLLANQDSVSKRDQESRRSITGEMDMKKSDRRSPADSHLDDRGLGQSGSHSEGHSDDGKLTSNCQDNRCISQMSIQINTCDDECVEYEDDFESADGEGSPEPCRHPPPPYQSRCFQSDGQSPHAAVKASTAIERGSGRGSPCERKSACSGSMAVSSGGDMSLPNEDIGRSMGTHRDIIGENGTKYRGGNGKGSGIGSNQEPMSSKSHRTPSPAPSTVARNSNIAFIGKSGLGSPRGSPSTGHARRSSGTLMRSQSACNTTRRSGDDVADAGQATSTTRFISKSESSRLFNNNASQPRFRSTDTGPRGPSTSTSTSSALIEQRRMLEQRAADRRHRVLELHKQAEERVGFVIGKREQELM